MNASVAVLVAVLAVSTGCPVETVNWDEAKAFCAKLTAMLTEPLKGKAAFRLPTDAEWSVSVGLPAEQGSTPEEKDFGIKETYPWGTQWPPPEGVWLHTSWQVLPDGTRYPSNGLLVREGDALSLIDTAWGEQPTRDLLAWIARELKLPVTRTIVTHAHDDRMGGAPVLAEARIPVLSHPLTGALAAKQGWPRPAPLATLSEAGSSTNVGAVGVFYPSPAHTVDNLMVWIPRAQILFGGCAVKGLKSRNLGNVADADVAAWPEAILRAQKRYANQSRLVVPGHGEVGGPDLLSHTLALCAGQELSGGGAKPQQ